MPDFRAYRKQDKMPSYNDLGQEYPIKLPTRIREEPIKANGTGSLAFGHVQAELDCRMEDVGIAEHLAFTFAEDVPILVEIQ
jgi:hypothetical protein